LGQKEEAEKIYQELSDKNIEVLFDDREVSAGEKFVDADLIGIPFRVVVSKKSLEKGGVEVKERQAEKTEILKIKEFLKKLEK
jgi:prolyl-tRNA synthetase